MMKKQEFVPRKISEKPLYELNSDETVYIEYGAVVSGRIYSRMADRVRILGKGILYGGNWHAWDENGAGDSTGSDLQNSVCTTVQQKNWKYRNLDGMAIWLDRCHSADVDFFIKKSENSWNNSAQ